MKATVARKLEGRVTGSIVRLPRGVALAEGMRVGIVPLDPLPSDSPFLKTMLKLARRREQSRVTRRKVPAN